MKIKELIEKLHNLEIIHGNIDVQTCYELFMYDSIKDDCISYDEKRNAIIIDAG